MITLPNPFLGKPLAFFLILFFISPIVSAQNQECGSPTISPQLYQAYVDQVPAIQAYELTNNSSATKQIPVNFYIFRKDDGSGYTTAIDLTELDLGIDNLNDTYGGFDFEFFQCGPPTYIDNTILFEKTKDGLPLRDYAYSSSAVNVFIIPFSPSANYSFSAFPCFGATIPNCGTPDNYMVLSGTNGNALLTGPTLNHETGHTFGLLHTFGPVYTYTWPIEDTQLDHPIDGLMNGGFPRELVIRGFDNPKLFPDENCLIAGDLVCDTPVDALIRPNLQLYWPDPNEPSCPGPNHIPSNDPLDPLNCTIGVSYKGFPDCELEGDYIDYNGDPITNQPSGTPGKNIMSYHHSACLTEVTPGQGNRMNFIYDNYRQFQFDIPLCGNLSDEVDYWDTDKGLEDVVVRYVHSNDDRTCNTFTNSDGDFNGVLHDDVLQTEVIKVGSGLDLTYTRGDWAKSISVLDIVLILRDLAGITPLVNGYAKIAADVDNSGTINTLDVIGIQRMILWYQDEFPAFEQPWRFVPEYIPNDFSLDFHSDPFNMTIGGTTYQDNIPYLNKDWEYTLSDGTNGNGGFDALKVGDVSGNAQPGFAPTIECEALVDFLVQPKALAANKEIEVEVLAYGFNNVSGFQMGINLPFSDYELVDIQGMGLSGFTLEDNAGTNKLEENQLALLWYNTQAQSFADGTPLYKLILKTKSAVNLSGTLTKQEALENVFYEISGCQVPVDLEFVAYTAEERSAKTEAVNIGIKENKIQCFPNPTTGEATIVIDVTDDIRGDLELYNSLGKLVNTKALTVAKGRNTQAIDFSAYSSGIYWLAFKNEKGVRLGQRLVIK